MTEKEKWISDIKSVVKRCPKDFWIFVASGTLNVMAKKNGARVYRRNGCVDQDYCVDTIKGIECDGGDW